MIKLNGQIYLSKSQVFCIVDECTESIKNARYYEVSPAIGDIKPDIKTRVVTELNKFRSKLELKFEGDKYIGLSSIYEYVTQQMYDSRKVKVGKYQQGAFGLRLSAEPPAVTRYVFNVCMKVISKNLSNSI